MVTIALVVAGAHVVLTVVVEVSVELAVDMRLPMALLKTLHQFPFQLPSPVLGTLLLQPRPQAVRGILQQPRLPPKRQKRRVNGVAWLPLRAHLLRLPRAQRVA